jgi:DNA-binding MarR family transcriptional regulator
VVRTDHREDRRVIIAKITPKGRRWLDGYFPGHSRMMASFASALSKEERATLIRLLGKMRQGIVKNVAAMEKAKP